MPQQLAFSVFRKIDLAPDVAVNGQVFTKRHIVELMLDLAGYSGQRSVRLLDPGCGAGAFTIAAAVRLIRTGGIPKSFADVENCICAVEKNPEAVGVCREQLIDALVTEGVAPKLASRLARHWVVEGDFLECELSPVFDFVIGNPPYVRQEAIPKAKLERYRAEFDCFYDRADLYVAFFEKGLKLLARDGRLTFICPDRFAKNNYGRKLRAFIASGYAVEQVVDLAQASPFEQDVTCYPGIFVIRRGKRTKHVDYFRLTNANPKECDYVRQMRTNGVVAYHRYDSWFEGEQQWSIESPRHLELLRRLETEFVALGSSDSGCRVGIGVATGADKVFIVDQHTDEIERELLMPLATTKDIASGVVEWQGQCVINPFVGNSTKLIDLGRYPKARDHFLNAKKLVEGRNVAKRDQTRWYRTIDRIYPDLQKLPKLLIPDIKADNLIVLETGKLYPHHNLYYVAADDWNLRALRTILRSSIGKFFVWMYGVKMRGDFLRFQAQYLRRICIPRLESMKKQAINRLLSVDDATDQDEIDAAVADVYGLTDAEMILARDTSAVRRQRTT
jgi:methylase of polypeptide subunit release factors